MGLSRRAVLRAGGVATVLGAGGTFAYGRLAPSTAGAYPTALVAGSLLHVATEVPGASVEAHGSATVRRLVVDGLRDPDAVALADPRLFAGISDRVTFFATNALVLAYDPASDHAEDLERDWRRAITADGIEIGRTDPRQDPLGYRTVMALELAERRFGIDAGRVLDSSHVFPETDLMNVLEGGGIDAAFVYRNMAVERGLPAASLPDRIDFSEPDYAEEYASVSYELDHATVHGTPIRYAATATSPRGEGWTEDLVTARGTLEENGFVVPPDYPRFDVPLEFPRRGATSTPTGGG